MASEPLCEDEPGWHMLPDGAVATVDHNGCSVQASRFEPALQLIGEQQVGELALPVGQALVIPLGGIQIVETDAAPFVRQTAEAHDARIRGFVDQRQQQAARAGSGAAGTAAMAGPAS